MGSHPPISPDTNSPPSTAQDSQAENFNQIFEMIYRDLRRLAMAFRNGSRVTMSATEIVNDAYLKLLASSVSSLTDPLHIKRIAARALRQILIDAIRRKGAESHGGLLQFVSLKYGNDAVAPPDARVLNLHAALEKLSRTNPRMAEIIEFRYFGGFTNEEIRLALGVSLSTVQREIRDANLWLAVFFEKVNGKRAAK